MAINQQDCHFEELGHTSEIGLRVRADAPEQLFACAAKAMFHLLRVPTDTTKLPVQHRISLDSIDGESLLVDWLSELIYLHETTGAIFLDCTVLRWTATHLEAEVCGFPPVEMPAIHLKAATYHQLLLQANADGWMAQIYFDI